MISSKLATKLNEQISEELHAAYCYRQMSIYLKSINLDGGASFMSAQAREEEEHAQKIIEYLQQFDVDIKLKQLDTPRSDFTSLEDVLQEALKNEQQVTRNFIEMYEEALSEKDHVSKIFIEWFITEQAEEEDQFKTLLDRLTLFDNSTIVLFDKELGERQ